MEERTINKLTIDRIPEKIDFSVSYIKSETARLRESITEQWERDITYSRMSSEIGMLRFFGFISYAEAEILHDDLDSALDDFICRKTNPQLKTPEGARGKR